MRTTATDTKTAARTGGGAPTHRNEVAGAQSVAADVSGAALERQLRRFFWGAARVTRRDPRQAMVFARAAARQKGAGTLRREWNGRGVYVPPLLLMSLTESAPDGMTGAEIREVLAEAAELGVALVCLGGGEPVLRPGLLDIAAQFPELVFVLVTGGRLLDDNALDRLECSRNIIPVLRLEGLGAGGMRSGHGSQCHPTAAMAAMKARRLFFGVSLVLTRSSFPAATSRVFVRDLVEQGCRLFSYVDHLPTEAGVPAEGPSVTQRRVMPLTLDLLRKEFPAVFVASTASERALQGCLAAGRGFVHVDADGALQACTLLHRSDANVCVAGLRRALESPLLKQVREGAACRGETVAGCASCPARRRGGSLLGGPEQLVTRGERLVA